jgi:hypothetical protein
MTIKLLAIAIAAMLAGCASQRFQPQPQPQQYQRPSGTPVPGAPFERDKEDVPRAQPGKTHVNPEYREEQEAAPLIWNTCPASLAVQLQRGWRCV